MGSFARSGNSAAMRRGLGHYVGTGYDGSSTAVRRFGGTVNTADALYSALSSGTSADAAAGDADLTGATVAELVEEILPIDGTQDREASRAAAADAEADLLTRFPEANLSELDDEQRMFFVERYVAADVYRRVYLDLGKHVQDKAPTAAAGLSRLRQMRDYIRETVSAAFRKRSKIGSTATTVSIRELVRDALRETFEVFEDYGT